ncbi:MAG: hypothetical protein ACK4NA_05875 [Alphaproteobacteria bacterium]
MRFISVVAAVGAALGATFDFGLAQSQQAASQTASQAASVAPADWVRVTAPEAGFAASFPSQPQVQRSAREQGGEAYKSVRYTASAPNIAMAVEYSVYDDPAIRIDLDRVMNGFADAMNGKVVAKWQTSYARGFGAPLPKLEYTVQTGETICRAGAIADGPAVYQVIGCANKAASMPLDIERMLASFVLTPRAAS